MTDLPTLIALAKELNAKATPGPWTKEKPTHHYGMRKVLGPAVDITGFTIATNVDSKRAAQIEDDAAFIAASRTLVPALVAEIERLLREREWQPIETAPRDGTNVWVYAAPFQDLPGFQCRYGYHPEGGWCVDELREVTHWQPLLLPPDKEPT